jgi:hypothetical protein
MLLVLHRGVIILLLVSGLAACHWLNLTREEGANRATPQPKQQLPELAQWLEQRQQLCRQTRENRRLQVPQPVPSSAQGDSSPQRVLERLALASCEPGLNPGLLRQAISKAQALPSLPPDYRALMQLMDAHLTALEQLTAEKQAEVAALKNTLEALTKIEQQLEKKE